MATQTDIDRKRARHEADLDRSTHGHVPTPAILAELLTSYPYSTLDSLPDAAPVLEPSAGCGPLARAILDAASHVAVHAVEPHPGRVAELRSWAQGLHRSPRGAGAVHVHPTTLEDFTALEPVDGRFAAVIMNPPWSTPKRPRLWAEHVVTAWRTLRPGGRLAAIVPEIMGDPGYQPAGAVGAQLRALVDAQGGTDPVDVAGVAGRGAVRAGFPARACVLWLVRPIPTADGRPSWLLSPTPGEPVPVDRLDLGPVGAQHTPVQAYPDRWAADQVRVIRFAGTCATCARLLWTHDDGDDASLWVPFSVTAEASGHTGPPVGLCLECGHDKHRRTQARQLARPYWTTNPELTAPATRPDLGESRPDPTTAR